MAILLIGATLVSAGVLSYFAQVSGEVDTKQAITLLDSNDNYVGSDNKASFDFAGEDITPPKTYRKVYSIKNNNGQKDISVQFDTECMNGSVDSDSGVKAGFIDWSNNCEGIDTKYVEYFDGAGADIPDYDGPEYCNVTVDDDSDSGDYDTIQGAIDDKGSWTGDTICVEEGTYMESLDIDVEGLTVVSVAGPENTIINATSASDYVIQAVVISADGVTVKGFTVENAKAGEKQWGFYVIGNPGVNPVENCVVKDNIVKVRNDRDQYTGAIHLIGANDNVVENNKVTANSDVDPGSDIIGILVEESDNSILRNNIAESPEYAGIMIWSGSNNEVTNNTVKNSLEGVYLSADNSDWDTENNVVKYNKIKGNEKGIQFWDGAGIPLGNEIHYNNIVGNTEYDIKNVMSDTTLTVNATNNYWGTDGISTSGKVTATWEPKENDITVEAGSTDKFAYINDFQTNLESGTYKVVSDLNAVNPERTE